jgi:hypothetical protein
MRAASLLRDIEATGIRLHAAGDRLRAEIPAGANIGSFRERIQEAKPELLAALREREGIGALGLDPSLPWVHVSTAPVAATLPPAGWESTIPAGCGVPAACQTLGPCPHVHEHGRCWHDTEPV